MQISLIDKSKSGADQKQKNWTVTDGHVEITSTPVHFREKAADCLFPANVSRSAFQLEQDLCLPPPQRWTHRWRLNNFSSHFSCHTTRKTNANGAHPPSWMPQDLRNAVVSSPTRSNDCHLPNRVPPLHRPTGCALPPCTNAGQLVVFSMCCLFATGLWLKDPLQAEISPSFFQMKEGKKFPLGASLYACINVDKAFKWK